MHIRACLLNYRRLHLHLDLYACTHIRTCRADEPKKQKGAFQALVKFSQPGAGAAARGGDIWVRTASLWARLCILWARATHSISYTTWWDK